MHNPLVDPHFASVCRTRLLDLADSCPGLLAASVSSKDGVVIASWGASEENTKIAVIAGTLHAVSESVVEEADLQSCRNVAIEATRGRIALVALPGTFSDYVLTGVVGSQTTLGMLLGCCRVCCERIASQARKEPAA
jgi:predicted regulator of Ras-like GTPase activity (Roadblock/LC7/MglB family)